MKVRETGQRRDHLVDDGVVLHRAAAQRVELLADRVVHGGEPAVVAHDLGLAESRQRRRRGAEEIAWERRLRIGGGDVRARQPGSMRVRAALLKAQELGHELSISTSSSMALGSLTSVQVKVWTPFRSLYQRPTSSPPRMPFRASFRFMAAAGFGDRIGNSLRNR